MAYEYELIATRRDRGVLFATISNPPINIMTGALYRELVELTAEVEVDDTVSVVVLQSADPDFFIAHFDVELILTFDISEAAVRADEQSPFHKMCERLRLMSKATIAKIAGRVGGGGSELAASCDMRFGVLGKTKVNQMEVGLGILPGGTGTQRLPRLLGRGRALEVILGGDDLDAETAERWGYLNRIFEADEIGPFVDRLAKRIGSFPPPAVRLAKESVNAAEKPWLDGLFEEAYLFERLVRTDEARRNMQRFLDIGGQTRDGELRINELNAELGDE